MQRTDRVDAGADFGGSSAHRMVWIVSLTGALSTAALALGLFWWSGSAALAFVASLGVGVVWGLILHQCASRHLGVLEEMQAIADEVRRGGRLQEIDSVRLSRLAGVGESFNLILRSLAAGTRRVSEIMSRVEHLPERISTTMREIETSSQAQEEVVEETASLLANINGSIRRINERVDALSSSAEESSSSVLEMGSSVDEVARSTASLHEFVENATSSVNEMGASIRQVAANTENLQTMAEECASSMIEMDRSVQEVGGHAREASALSERVSHDAEQGAEAVSATIEDIEQIHSLTSVAKDGLEKLVARTAEVAGIMVEIDAINDETNLLSLNAAIIAAQAGERGKAFLVVANHVKTLARRTGASTKDIERLIGSIREESDNAVAAMEAGITATEKGVDRSRMAGEALAEIRRTARASSERVREIARATEEQALNSRTVAGAVQETSSQAQQISAAIAQQRAASEQMLQVSERALDMCRHVHRSTDEQRETGHFITESISSITEMIREIQENTSMHAKASESVSEAVMRLLENARRTGERVPEVNRMLADLGDGARAILSELERFQGSDDSAEVSALPAPS